MECLSGGIEDPPGCLGGHVTTSTLTVPALDRLYNMPVGRQLGTVRSNVVDRSLHLVEDEDSTASGDDARVFVVRFQRHFKHAKPLVLEDDFVMLGSATTASNAKSHVEGSRFRDCPSWCSSSLVSFDDRFGSR